MTYTSTFACNGKITLLNGDYVFLQINFSHCTNLNGKFRNYNPMDFTFLDATFYCFIFLPFMLNNVIKFCECRFFENKSNNLLFLMNPISVILQWSITSICTKNRPTHNRYFMHSYAVTINCFGGSSQRAFNIHRERYTLRITQTPINHQYGGIKLRMKWISENKIDILMLICMDDFFYIVSNK